MDRRNRGRAVRRRARRGDRRADRPGRPDHGRGRHDHPRTSRDIRDRRHDEPARAARGRRGRHAVRTVRRAPGQARADRGGGGEGFPVPRHGLGRLYRAGERGRLSGTAAAERLRGLGGLAVRPHRVPHRLPEPGRRHPHLVAGLHPRHPQGTRLHHPRGRAHARHLPDGRARAVSPPGAGPAAGGGATAARRQRDAGDAGHAAAGRVTRRRMRAFDPRLSRHARGAALLACWITISTGLRHHRARARSRRACSRTRWPPRRAARLARPRSPAR